MPTITVGQYEGGDRLDAWLARTRPEFSRSYFQKLIKSGNVKLNGKAAKAHTVVQESDVIEIAEEPKKKIEEEKRDLPPLKIIEETGDYLVIDKPSGLLVHPGPKQKTGTLVDLLLAHDPKISDVGDSELRPGIVHRLDRDSSGLMVIARTQEAFDHLKAQFQDREVEKTYLALVHGKVSKDEGVITTPLGRSRDKGRMVARTTPKEDDKEAETRYDVVTRFPHATLVEARPKTGRMHQIRVHLRSIGHPIAGDRIYVPGKLKTGSLRPPRLFLHAATLAFHDLDGKRREYHAELPDDLREFLETLKRRHKK